MPSTLADQIMELPDMMDEYQEGDILFLLEPDDGDGYSSIFFDTYVDEDFYEGRSHIFTNGSLKPNDDQNQWLPFGIHPRDMTQARNLSALARHRMLPSAVAVQLNNLLMEKP